MDEDYKNSEAEVASIEKTPDEIISAIENIVKSTKQLSKIESVKTYDDGTINIIIRTTTYDENTKRIASVGLIKLNESLTQIQSYTKEWSKYSSQPMASNISKKLVRDIFRYFGQDDEAKEFMKKSDRKDLKNFGSGIFRGFKRTAIAVVIVIIILAIIRFVLMLIK